MGLQTVQNLSACRVNLQPYSQYGPYGFYRTSVPVEYSYTSALIMGRIGSTAPRSCILNYINLIPLSAEGL